jgi:predicted methyltransferase
MRHTALLAPMAGFILAITTTAPDADPAKVPVYVEAALEDAHRPAADVTADASRKPAELLVFAGARPGSRIVDYIPGGGYFTRIFSKVVGPTGRVYAVWPDEYAKVDDDSAAALKGLTADPAYVNVEVLPQPAQSFKVPEPVDLIWTSQNYHDLHDKFMGPPDILTLDKAMLAALKPGGVLVVEDHVAEAGSGLRDTDTLHRIDPATIRKELTAAGFVFDGESSALRNPADDHKLNVFDKAIRGHTDQVVYKFHRP